MDGGEKKEVRRPMNAFLIFCKRHRGFVREKNPDMDNRSVTRVLGDLWANLGEEKKTYTNLAKQYKDAFMKANPNYKWHSADKSQSCSGKMVSKPTNSRVIKSVTEIQTDGSITPGKLADPEKMGGLNLLLMADKETCAPLATSVPLSSTRTMALFQPALSGHASASAADQSMVSSSALLQLAEMCSSELHDRNEKMLQLSFQSLPAVPFSVPLSDLTCVSQQPMPPPKKRVRHWSLTETEPVADASSDGNRECITGSLSPQNTCTQKTRCTSLGSTLSPADRYSSVSAYRPYPSRRKLSSSATESIPSPTGPLEDVMDDTDSPVFSPDATRQEILSGESRLDSHDHFNYLPQNLSQSASRSPTLVSKTSVHIPSFDQKGQSVGKKLPKPMTPNPVTVSLQQPLSILTGISGSVLSVVPDHTLPNTSHGMLLSLYSAQKSYGNREVDAKSDNGNDSFSAWRELDKRRTKSEELLPKALNLHVSSCYIDETCPPSTSQRHCHEKQVKYKSLGHGLTRFEPKSDIEKDSASSSLPVDLSFVTGACSVAKTSVLSKGRIASILNNSNAPSEMFHLDPSNFSSASETLSKMNSEAKKLVKSSVDKNELVNYKATEQCSSLPILTSSGTNNSIHLQPGFKIIETQGSNLSINNPQVFREVKLKKKWTERMLIETKLQDLTQRTEHSGGNSLSNETFNVRNHSDMGADAYALSRASKPDKVLLQNFNDAMTPGSNSNNETTVLKTPSSCDIPSLQALFILNQSEGLPEVVPNHRHVPASFCPSKSSHTKLMLQLSQNQQTDRQGETKPKSFCDEPTIKSEPCVVDFSIPQQDYKYVNINQRQRLGQRKEDSDSSNINRQDESIKNMKGDSTGKDYQVKSEEFNKKQVMNQIAACGKKFMDRIVEQLCKSDFSGGGQSKADVSLDDECGDHGPHLEDVKPDTDDIESFREDTRGGLPAEWLKKEEHRDCRILEESCSVENMVPRTMAELDHAVEDENTHSTAVRSLPSKHGGITSGTEDTSTQRNTGVNISAETRVQNPWTSAMGPECEQSDVNEDSSMQPVRKSRRANRGQKYQELIKEGFIQPSRERMAARNAERCGRSFGTREEFDKMELKRTLKRSASEKDVPSDCPVVFSTGSAMTETSVDKRFTSGDFDLEKEIESLPVCSLEQLDRKKSVKRRCEGDSLGLPPSHRANGDAVSTLKAPACTNHSKLGPVGGSVSKFDDLGEPCCPAPHIPLPKEERPTEPVTGSRKRKARKHCIMRISLLDEKAPLVEMAVQRESLPSACLEKQSCSLPRDTLCDSVNVCGSVNSCSSVNSCGASGSADLVSSTPPACKAEASGERTSLNIVAQDCPSKGNDSAFECTVSSSQAFAEKGRLVLPTSILSARNVSDNFPSLSLASSSSSRSSMYKTLSESQFSSADTGQNPPKLSGPLFASVQYGQRGTTSSSLETAASSSSLETLALTASVEAAASVTSLIRGPAMLKSPDYDLHVVESNATDINSDWNCSLSVRTAKPEVHLVNVNALTRFNPALSGKESPKTKSMGKSSRKTMGGKVKTNPIRRDERNQAEVKKSKSPSSRKYNQKNERNVYVKSSSTPLVSALLGHIDLSYALQCAERGESRMVSVPQLWADYKTSEPAGENGSVHPSSDTASLQSAETTSMDFSSPVLSVDTSPLSTLRTHLIEGHDNEFSSGAVSKEVKESVILLNSVQKPTVSSSSALSPEDSYSRERPLAAIRGASSSSHKPHPSMLSVTATGDTAKAKPPPSVSPEAPGVLDSGSSSSLLQNPSLCPLAASGSPINHSVYLTITSALTSSNSSPLHSSFLSQVSSSSSCGISTVTRSDNTTYASSTLPLSPLTQPTSPPLSSAALPSSSPTVISLATSIPSTKNDIVSYTVIGSTSVIESGSPHMIGSPHLPESPSVAIVQS